MLYAPGMGRRSHAEAHLRADNVDVTWTGAPVILPHTINVKREMFVEGVADAAREPVPHPPVQAPIIKNFVANCERELRLTNLERMLDQNGIAISPGIHFSVHLAFQVRV